MMYQEYHSVIKAQLEVQFDQEGANIEKAAEYCAASVSSGRVIHVFGCGHSQMFAMEVFYRAGGLVPVNALLIPHLALFPKAKLSTLQERVEGFTGNYLELEDVDARDTMIIVSISGRNAGVVDMALEAKKIGMKVVALVSKQFASSTTSRHSSGKNLMDLADVVIDIKCVAGDAVLELDGLESHFCGTSTVLGMGSSLILKMTVDKAMKELGVTGHDIEHWDAGTVDSKNADLIVTSADFQDRFAGRENVIFVKNVVNNAEVKEALKEYLEKHQLM